jgi:hypothetical protein
VVGGVGRAERGDGGPGVQVGALGRIQRGKTLQGAVVCSAAQVGAIAEADRPGFGVRRKAVLGGRLGEGFRLQHQTAVQVGKEVVKPRRQAVGAERGHHAPLLHYEDPVLLDPAP